MNRTNALRNLSLSLLLAAGALAAPVHAQINFNINVAPPAPQQEVVPALSPGQVWAPGYWGWNGDRYVWLRGRTIAQRDGFRWVPDRWEQQDRSFVRRTGHWERDHDARPVKVKKQKMKKQKKRKGDDHGNHGRGNNGKHRGERS